MPMRKTIKSNLLGKHAQLSTNLLFNLKNKNLIKNEPQNHTL